MPDAFQLDGATVLDLVGADAPAILHNLTTNEVKLLQIGCGCETFITDVRGKTLAHVSAFRTAEGYRMIGAAGQAESIAAHVDRYTIREDAAVVDRSDHLSVFVLAPTAPEALRSETDWGLYQAFGYDVDWLGEGTIVLLAVHPDGVREQIESQTEIGSEQDFHQSRVIANFPWYGVDLSEKNLPQEASRIRQTISFTKGCYLGQETVARLDALGQVQKQLVRWKTAGAIPIAGSEVRAAEKVVGKLTSVTPIGSDQAVAIGMARRSHFDSGANGEGDGFQAVVE